MDKARVALEELDGINAAYVSDSITLHLSSKDGFNKEQVAKTLKPFQIIIKEAKALKNPTL